MAWEFSGVWELIFFFFSFFGHFYEDGELVCERMDGSGSKCSHALGFRGWRCRYCVVGSGCKPLVAVIKPCRSNYESVVQEILLYRARRGIPSLDMDFPVPPRENSRCYLRKYGNPFLVCCQRKVYYYNFDGSRT